MRSPINEYRNATNKAELRKNAYEFFNEKYFKHPYEDLDGLFDTTERILAKKLNFFLPGRIYTWQYDPIGKDYLSYYDKRPMVLVHSQYVSKSGNMIVQGLNLNLLPEEQRAQVMEIFNTIFASDVKEAQKSIDKDEIGIMKKAWQFLTDWYYTIKIFNEQGKIGYQWAYRNYIIPRMTSPVLIEMEDWAMIPYFIPKEFMGKLPAQIWSDYTKYKAQLMKYQPDANKSKLNQKRYTKPGG